MDVHGNTRAVLGPFSAREVTYLGGAGLLTLATLFSLGLAGGDFASLVLGLLVPDAAAFGLAWRRLRGLERRELASFSLDQAAGVAGLGALVVALGGLGGAGGFSQVLALIGAVALIAATWGAAWIKDFAADFLPEEGTALLRCGVRPSSPGAAAAAEAGARPAASTSAPAAPAPAAQAQQAVPTPSREAGTPSLSQPPFWFAVPTPRVVFDAAGSPVFTLQPGLWWLAVATSGEGLLVRHDDGREGVLAETTGLEIA